MVTETPIENQEAQEAQETEEPVDGSSACGRWDRLSSPRFLDLRLRGGCAGSRLGHGLDGNLPPKGLKPKYLLILRVWEAVIGLKLTRPACCVGLWCESLNCADI